MRVPVPLGPSSDRAKQRQGGGALIINGYVEKTEGGKTPYSINTRQRLREFASVGTSGCRGAISVNNAVYAVFGETLFKIAAGGVAVALGTIVGFKPVIMSANRRPTKQITITSDTLNYVCEGDVLTVVSDPDLPSGVTSNCYSNGRTVYGINDGLHYWSDDENSLAIDALNFAEAERDSDAGVRVFPYGEDFWHFGTRSREIIRFTGNIESLFEPLLGAGQGEGDGLGAKHSVLNINGTVIWVNDSFKVVVSSGGKAEPISSNEVSRDVQAAITQGLADEITAFGVTNEGHDFYYIRCPLWCWCFDLSTGLWSKINSYGSDTFRCGFAVEAFNKTILFDVLTGKAYEYTDEARDDAGEHCILEIIPSPVSAFPDGFICDALHLDAQHGVGLVSGLPNEIDPQVMLQVSQDGGMTYGITRKQSLGRVGAYDTRIRYARLGSTKGAGMVFKISISEPVKRAVFSAAAELRSLRG